MDRRTTLKWVLAASAAGALLGRGRTTADAAHDPAGYGTDPKVLKTYHPGELWPLTFSAAERRLATVLCDLIVPADERSPSASEIGVVEFIDEWISAPYPEGRRDRPIVLGGFGWLNEEAGRRFATGFAEAQRSQQGAICDDICDLARAAPERQAAAQFFARYRDLTAGGFYSTPAGRKDLGYIGNVPLARFDGPPAELLRKLNLL
jgi:Gluconate 2-dehydrogenase subunit 3